MQGLTDLCAGALEHEVGLSRRALLPALGTFLLAGLGALEPASATDTFPADARILPSRWDEAAGLVVGPGGGPGYATRTTSKMVVHDTRRSADYAVAIADEGGAAAAERISRIVTRLADLQDVDPASATYGTWSWYVEEPLAEMRPPDLNWACFIGARLAELLWSYSDLMTASTQDRARQAVNHACACVVRRNVSLDATNVVIMGIRLTAMAGRLLGRPDLSKYGANLLDRFIKYTRAQGGFVEYNSPTYTNAVLVETEAFLYYQPDERLMEGMRSIWQQAWQVAATHFHPATGQWAGPHSRAYTELLVPTLWASLAARLGHEVSERELPLLPSRKGMLPCPEDLRVLFTADAPMPRAVVERVRRYAETGEEVWTSTWLEPDACLGSASIANCWIQAHPVIGYWNALPKPAVFRARVMKDGYDFASFGMRAQQKERSVLVACYPVINSGDKHLSADRSGSGYPGKSLVFRLSVEGAGAHAAQLDPGVFVLACQNWKAVVRGGPCMFDGVDISGRWTMRTEAGLAVAELVIPLNGHISPEKLGSTLLVASVTLGPVDESIAVADIKAAEAPDRTLASAGTGASLRTVTWGDLRLASPAGPAWR